MNIETVTHANEFYKVRVADYAIPAICDSEVNYYDTAGNIRQLYERSLTGREPEEAERCLAAMEEYLSGRGPGNIQLQFEEPRPLLSRVKLLGKRAWEYGSLTYRFSNIWNFEDDITMDGVRVDAVYLEDSEPVIPEERLIRCVKLQIERPRTPGSFDTSGKRWMNYWEIRFWGYPHMIVKKDPNILINSLYYPDRFFQTAAEAERDMEQPGPVDFRRFFLEIHGDG